MIYARYSSWLRKHILWLVKSKLIILNISWFTPYFLIRISVEHRDFLHFFNSWNNKLLSLPTWKLSNKIKLNTQIYFFIHSYYHITWIYTSHFRAQNNEFFISPYQLNQSLMRKYWQRLILMKTPRWILLPIICLF